MRMGKFAEAETLWRELAQRFPKNASILAGLGVALATEGKLQLAVEEYRRSLALDPHQADLELDLALAEFRQGHFISAIPALKAVLLAKPDDGRVTLLLGMSYFGLHQYEKRDPLLDHRKQDQSFKPSLSCTTYSPKVVYGSKQYDCALSEFKNILEVNPDSVQAHMLLALALDGLNKTPDAIMKLQSAERMAPNEPNLHFKLGYLYYRVRDYDQAVKEFQVEIDHDPSDSQAYRTPWTHSCSSQERLLRGGAIIEEGQMLCSRRTGSPVLILAWSISKQSGTRQPSPHSNMLSNSIHRSQMRTTAWPAPI